MRIHDITPVISPDLAVFPGDTPYQRDVLMDFAKGDHLGLSAIKTTLHLGAHVDAPNHYHRDGQGIGTRSLEHYLGRCQVITVSLARGERVRPEHVKAPIEAKRVLFKTGSFPDPNRWNSDFCSLSPELIEKLADQGVILVGIDTPSIDPEQSKALESHQAIHARDVAVLEGVVLDRVPDGVYTLIALPLKLKDADASPVRAILVEEGTSWRT